MDPGPETLSLDVFTCHAMRSLSFSIFSWASGCSCRYRSVKKAWRRQGEPLRTPGHSTRFCSPAGCQAPGTGPGGKPAHSPAATALPLPRVGPPSIWGAVSSEVTPPDGEKGQPGGPLGVASQAWEAGRATADLDGSVRWVAAPPAARTLVTAPSSPGTLSPSTPHPKAARPERPPTPRAMTRPPCPCSAVALLPRFLLGLDRSQQTLSGPQCVAPE